MDIIKNNPAIFVTGIVFVLLFAAERLFRLRSSTRVLFGRLLVNFVFSALAFAAAALLVKPAALATMDWSAKQPFGLLHLVGLTASLQLVLGFLALDLSFYYWHIATHRVPILWRFHNVHHIDPDLDVSTAFRFHFGEVAISTCFRVLQVAVIGVPLWIFLIYEVAFQANTAFHHSNLRLPIRLERLLNLIIVTPRMHGIHHSQVRNETNSNFSTVLSIWDRLHRTIGLNIPQSEIVVGVPGYSLPDDNRLWHCLTLPCRRQRNYWRKPDGTVVERPAAGKPTSRHVLAE